MLPARDELPVRIPKPWGHEIWWAWTDDYVGKILHIAAGERLSVQYHEEKDETSYVLSGRLTLLKGPSEAELEPTEIGPGDSWRNRPGELHALEALEDADVLEVSTPQLDDVVRVSDRYGRGGNAP